MPSPNILKGYKLQVESCKLAQTDPTRENSPIHLSHNNIHTAQNDHHVRHRLPQAHVFENRQIHKARRADSVAVGVWRTLAYEIKAKLGFRRFGAGKNFARFLAGPPQPRLWLDNRARGKFP